ncbi:hypothetical protein ACQ4PT_070633 [Festuca glaucescens]
MVLPLVKLGSLAFRTLSKPIAGRLKHHAGVHPKFRGFIIGLAQAIKKRLDELDMEKQIMMQRLAEMEMRTGGVGWVFPRLLNFSLAQPAAQRGGTQQPTAV